MNTIKKTLGMIVLGLSLGLTSCDKNPEYTLVKGETGFVEHYPTRYLGLNSDSTLSITIRGKNGTDTQQIAPVDGVYFGNSKYDVTKLTNDTLMLRYASTK